ncbi:MAG: hypothetical protein MUP09_08340 [Thiovulaceae bacterium]|nr:hypothetical protein [Sulfurimonadaceae bacterium]
MKRIIPVLALLVSLSAADTFVAGSKSIGVTAGTGSVSYSSGTGTNVENYFVVGVRGDYFVRDNLSVGVGFRSWTGGTPTLQQVTLPVTYYMPTQTRYRPYLGAFYRYTYVGSDRYDNYSSIGARAGVAILFENGYAGFGWAQEVYLNRDNVSSNSSGYPEAVIGFSF